MFGSRTLLVTPDEALSECEATIRRFDPDRYFASLFAPASRRLLLFALYAFNHEIAHAVEVAREPMMAEIRLQWWREAVEASSTGHPPAHPVSIGLAEIFARTSAPREWFVRLVDAQLPKPDPFATILVLEDFACATSAAVMHIAACILDSKTELRELVREAGIAYGLARTLCAFPVLATHATSSGFDPTRAISAIEQISAAARTHLVNARRAGNSKPALAAFLPASLVPSYLARAERVCVAFDQRVEISPLRRQLVLLRAATLGRL